MIILKFLLTIGFCLSLISSKPVDEKQSVYNSCQQLNTPRPLKSKTKFISYSNNIFK